MGRFNDIFEKEKLDIELDIDLDNNGYGSIKIKKNKSNYIWYFQDGHFYVKYVIDQSINKSNNLDGNQLYNIKSGKNIFLKCYDNYLNNHHAYVSFNNNDFYNFNFQIKENLISYLDINLNNNRERLYKENRNLYSSVYLYILNNFNDDQLDRIDIELELMTDDDLKKIKKLRINTKFTEINELEVHKKLINLNTLILDSKWQFNHIEFKLPNLKKLVFKRNTYNKPLNNMLLSLNNLVILKLNKFFDQPLDNSLNNLINLEQLIFGDGFNKPLGNSLKNLKKLKVLTFGRRFNQPLEDSLVNLVNLEELNFLRRFVQSFGNYFNLKKLQKVSLGHMNIEILIDNLKRLKSNNNDLKELSINKLSLGNFDNEIKISEKEIELIKLIGSFEGLLKLTIQWTRPIYGSYLDLYFTKFIFPNNENYSLKFNKSIININLIELHESQEDIDKYEILDNLNFNNFINFLPQNIEKIFINSKVIKNYLIEKVTEHSKVNNSKKIVKII